VTLNEGDVGPYLTKLTEQKENFADAIVIDSM